MGTYRFGYLSILIDVGRKFVSDKAMAGLDSTTGPERPATVEDMIGWLEEDGCSRGIIGWKSDWTKEEIFGTPPSEPLVLGFKYGGGDQQGAEVPPQRDFDVNAAFRQQATAERREKHVKRMIQDHKNLVPAANREIDGRLLKAGLSPECLKTLDTGHASDIYTKLQRLSEITGPEPPPPRIQFQVMSDIRPGNLEKVNIYLPRTCTLEDFEETMIDHRLVRFLRFKQQQAFIGLGGNGWVSATQFGANVRLEANGMVSIGKQVLEQKMWMYQLVGEAEQPQDVDESAWKKIRDRYDFAWLMKVLVNDSSKQVMVCHVSGN